MEKNRRFIALIILAAYLSTLFIFTGLVTETKQTLGFNLYLVILGVTIATIAVIFVPRYISFQMRLSEHSACASWIVGIAVALATFVIYFIYQRGYFPGGLTPDSYLQYKMAMGDEPLNNWHPALHTLIIYKLPLMFGRRLGMIIMLQVFYFSLAVGYTAYALYRGGIPAPFICLYGLYIWTNPFLSTYLMYSWKDLSLMICGLVVCGQYIRIVTTKGQWLNPWINRIFFALMLVICAYMRHNAILYVLPIVIIVLVMSRRRECSIRLSVLILIALFYLVVRLLYAGLHVEKADNLIIETIGTPITVWGNVMKNCPEVLPEDTRSVMYELADASAWETIYIPGSFEELRYSGEFRNDIADKMTYPDVFRYTWQCFTLAPEESWSALAKVTASAWSTYAEERPVEVDIWGNRYEIEPAPGLVGQEIDNQIRVFFSIAPSRIIYGSIGTFLLIMLTVACLAFPRYPACMLHIIPIFAYCFGTCPLLAGNYYRFFLIAIPIWIPVILLCLWESIHRNY